MILDLLEGRWGRCYSALLMREKANLGGRFRGGQGLGGQLRGGRMRLALLGVVALLLVGHILYWYWPRPRELDPSKSALAGLVFSEGSLSEDAYPLGLWVPYPHQNLGAVSRHWGSLPRMATDFAELADAPAPRWRSFGPFAVPPSRELAVLVDPEGGRAVAVARVYPLFAFVARVAGTLARNPWMSGGVIESGEGRIEVRWKGTRWQAVSGPKEGPTAEFPSLRERSLGVQKDTALFAALRLDDRLDLLPRGTYGLFREKRDLVLAGGGGGPGTGGAEEIEEDDPLPALDDLLVGAVSLVAVGLAGEEASGASETARGLVLFAGSENPSTPPGFALLNAQPAGRLPLAGLGLAALLGSEGHSGRASGWYVLANGERNFLRSAFLVPELARLTEGWKNTPEAGAVRWAASAHPAGVVEVLDVVAEALAGLGPGMSPEHRRISALARLLRPLNASPRATLVLRRAPGTAELRVERSH